MPSPTLSPLASVAATPTSPRQSTGGTVRPPILQRGSSQSSHGGSRPTIASPGSAGEHHPLRHAVGGRQRHAKIVPSRNHSSGRNLVRLGKPTQHPHQGVQQVEDGRKHARQRSHEGDTEIRLPGSLDENRPTIKRNMTAIELPRNRSSTKLKKNLSHGQLTRLNSTGRNLGAQTSASHKAPPSPGLKGKSKRPKSADMGPPEKDLHEQEVELHREQQERAQPPKKVGFAVASSEDTSEAEDSPPVEGSEPQEDEWTEESASASPYSTRQNTANNSRRTSVIQDRPPDKQAAQPPYSAADTAMSETKQPMQVVAVAPQQQGPEADGTPAQSEDEEEQEEELSPRSQAKAERQDVTHSKESVQPRAQQQQAPTQQPRHSPPPQHHPVLQQEQPKLQLRSAFHMPNQHPNPTTKRLVSNQHPAPALVSSVSALDSMHSSSRGSPAPSMRSARSNLGHDGATDLEQEELVSRFIPSASHPTTGSGPNTGLMNTPKQSSFQTPEEDSTLHRAKSAGRFQVGPGPVSPGSTISGSSGTATPALGRSRIELRMLHEKALADREAAAERQPLVPHHIYDRRNETLKSYLNLASLGNDRHGSIPSTAGLTLGPEIFQGRFKAVNTELKVVQNFRDPYSEAVGRLQRCRGTKLSQRSSPHKQAAALKMSKSAVTLPARGAVREGSKLSTSASPPKTAVPGMAKSVSPQKPAMSSGKSAVQIAGAAARHPRRGVSFAGTPPQTRDFERTGDERGPDAIARSLWDSIGG
ncbi:hypothetical protein LTR36_006343 [Oleoguttula mirabilis]|uniref:Uncharacterized protein n=1 Tax=Oleoguttula mirabilis TaxID=1507867 RepID=A0AAV9JW76_9PEZI|nr:hypothetical protein LTR36_006343 [Oleoguttula mirabilis]